MPLMRFRAHQRIGGLKPGDEISIDDADPELARWQTFAKSGLVDIIDADFPKKRLKKTDPSRIPGETILKPDSMMETVNEVLEEVAGGDSEAGPESR